MFLDKELDVICLLQAELKHSEPLLYKSNSFCKKVSRYIKSINSFSDNSGHEALPPDYYSDELNCMFDVMRVNDTEIRKTYNPVKIREREIEQEHYEVSQTRLLCSRIDESKESNRLYGGT